MNTKSLHTRLKMALLLHSRESGFAMVIAVSLGLIMILVGLTMTMRSQGDQITASQQKATDQALAAAEKGVAYYQQFINANRMLSTYPDCTKDRTNEPGGTACKDKEDSTEDSIKMSWSNVSKIPEISPACMTDESRKDIETDIETEKAKTSWEPVDSTDVTKGQFRLVSYRYDKSPNIYPGNGTLIVEGRMANSTSNDEETKAKAKAITQLKVVIPVKTPDIKNISVPGMWIGHPNDSTGTGNNTIQGNVLLNSCSVNLANIKIDPTTPQFSAQYTNLPMPDVPAMPAMENRVPNPDVPGTIPLGIINSNLTLPRPIDLPEHRIKFNDRLRYVYSATDIVKGGGSTTLTITPGQNVVIFLSGNISKNVDIIHSCVGVTDCFPTNFQIFGTKASGGEICLNGNRFIDAFILAPTYKAGVAGGGNDGGINGSIWVDDWSNGANCGSNTNNVVVRQTASWDELIGLQPKYLKPTIDRITSWQRQNIN